MHKYFFNPEDYKPETRTITLRGHILRENALLVSRHSGAEKLYRYDSEETDLEYMNNEGWDGEQSLSIFKNAETKTTLRVWCTPYDDYSIA